MKNSQGHGVAKFLSVAINDYLGYYYVCEESYD